MPRFPAAACDPSEAVHCPALGQPIADGLCWELSMADHGGPTDTAEQLHRWIATSERFGSVADFHRVCAGCVHCPWRERDSRSDAGDGRLSST